MLSTAPIPKTSVRPTTINVLPQELLLDIARHVYQGMPVGTDSQAQSTLGRLIDLQVLNHRWENAFEDPRSAAENAVAIHQCPSGKKLATALREMMVIDPEMQASSWDAVTTRMAAMNAKPSRNTVRQFLQSMPTQAPPHFGAYEWQQKRDLQLARFAARVLPKALDLAEDFLIAVTDSKAPMDGLVNELQDFACRHLDSSVLAKLLDEHLPRMPAYCRAGFEAVRACMGHGWGSVTAFRALIDTVNAAPARVRCRLLAQLGARVPTVFPLHADPGAASQALVDAIQELPRRHRLTALEGVVATGWEPKRAAMLIECLPSDPREASPHVEKFLAVFDTKRRLDTPHAYNTMIPVLKYIFNILREHGVAPALKAIALLAPRMHGHEQLRQTLWTACTAYQKMLPPANKALVALVSCALLARDGETKVSAFRVELQRLQGQPPETIAAVIAAMCEAGNGIPSYLVMSCLDTLKATMDRIPRAQSFDARAKLIQLVASFTQADRAAAGRQLALHANLPQSSN